MTQSQLIDNENDIAVAASFSIRVLLCVLLYPNSTYGGPRFPVRRIGVCSQGVKFYALGYAAIVFMLLIGLSSGTQSRRRTIMVVIVAAIGTLMIGGGWYLRNAIVTGSPLFPKQFFCSHDTFTELYPHPERSTLFGNPHPSILYLFICAVWRWTGPVQTIGFLFLPLTVGTLASGFALSWRAATIKTMASWSDLGLAGLILGSGCVLGVTPFAVERHFQHAESDLNVELLPRKVRPRFLSIATLGLASVLLRAFSEGCLLDNLSRRILSERWRYLRQSARRCWSAPPLLFSSLVTIPHDCFRYLSTMPWVPACC